MRQGKPGRHLVSAHLVPIRDVGRQVWPPISRLAILPLWEQINPETIPDLESRHELPRVRSRWGLPGDGRRHPLFDGAKTHSTLVGRGYTPSPRHARLGVGTMIDLCYTAANNAHFYAICWRANWLPGMRSDKRPCAGATAIQFIDARYAQPDFARHLAMVRRFRPRYARHRLI